MRRFIFVKTFSENCKKKIFLGGAPNLMLMCQIISHFKVHIRDDWENFIRLLGRKTEAYRSTHRHNGLIILTNQKWHKNQREYYIKKVNSREVVNTECSHVHCTLYIHTHTCKWIPYSVCLHTHYTYILYSNIIISTHAYILYFHDLYVYVWISRFSWAENNNCVHNHM